MLAVEQMDYSAQTPESKRLEAWAALIRDLSDDRQGVYWNSHFVTPLDKILTCDRPKGKTPLPFPDPTPTPRTRISAFIDLAGLTDVMTDSTTRELSMVLVLNTRNSLNHIHQHVKFVAHLDLGAPPCEKHINHTPPKAARSAGRSFSASPPTYGCSASASSASDMHGKKLPSSSSILDASVRIAAFPRRPLSSLLEELLHLQAHAYIAHIGGEKVLTGSYLPPNRT